MNPTKLLHLGVFAGLDLGKLAAHIWKSAALRAEGKLPAIRWRACYHGSVSGHAHPSKNPKRRNLTLSVGVGTPAPPEMVREWKFEPAPLYQVVEVLLHELVHCACPPSTNHSELFCRRLIAGAAEVFDIPVDVAGLLALDGNHQFSNRAYAIDHMLQRQMVEYRVIEKLRSDPRFAYVPEPEETIEEMEARIAEARLKRRNQNRAHVEEMLRMWDSEVTQRERALKMGRQIRAKWKQKLAGYDQRDREREAIAAKKKEG